MNKQNTSEDERVALFRKLCFLTAINHEIVNMPKEKTLAGLLNANPLGEFQRRLRMLNYPNRLKGKWTNE
jgi:hypothetical protein